MWYVLDMYHILFYMYLLYLELPIMLYVGSQSDSGKSNKEINEPNKEDKQ